MIVAFGRVPLPKKRERDKTCAYFFESTCMVRSRLTSLNVESALACLRAILEHCWPPRSTKVPARFFFQTTFNARNLIGMHSRSVTHVAVFSRRKESSSKVGELVDLQRNVYSGHTTFQFLDEIKTPMGNFSDERNVQAQSRDVSRRNCSHEHVQRDRMVEW